MGTKKTAVALMAFALLFAAAPSALATPITYDFTVTMPAGNGPEGGTVTHGSFTYDSSSVMTGATNSAANLLTALDFTWNGIAYTATTANTGDLTFDGSGMLTGFSFGPACEAGGCSIFAGIETWWASPGSFGFAYSVAGGSSIDYGDVTYSLAAASVPEPGNLALFAGGLLLVLGGFGVMRRRQRI